MVGDGHWEKMYVGEYTNIGGLLAWLKPSSKAGKRWRSKEKEKRERQEMVIIESNSQTWPAPTERTDNDIGFSKSDLSNQSMPSAIS
jgi:hypothetical protein